MRRSVEHLSFILQMPAQAPGLGGFGPPITSCTVLAWNSLLEPGPSNCRFRALSVELAPGKATLYWLCEDGTGPSEVLLSVLAQP